MHTTLKTNTASAAIREKSDEQLVRDLHRVENILMIETFGSDHEARRQLEAEALELFNELKCRGKLESQKKADQEKKPGVPRPGACPDRRESPLLPYVGKSQEELEEDEPRSGDHTKAERPHCEHKGSLPHPATHVLVWDLSSGRVTKFMCERHSKDAGPRPYIVAKLIGVNC
jgi:hypothetical protein